MTTMPKERCSARPHNTTSGGTHLCSRTAVVTEDGKPYCRQHLPSAVKAKTEAAKQRADKGDSEAAKEIELRRRAACFDDLVVALEAASDALDALAPQGDGDFASLRQVVSAALAKAKGDA